MKFKNRLLTGLVAVLILGVTGCGETTPDDIKAWKAAGNSQKLIKTLSDPRQFIRIDAIKALGELKSKEAITPLLNLFHDPDMVIVHEAIDAIVAIGDPSTKKDLITVLGFTSARAREVAATSLGNFKATEATDPLINALNDEHENVVVAAAVALGQIGNTQAIKPLSKKVTDRSFNTAYACVNAIAAIGGDEAVAALAPAMGNFSEKLRTAVIEGMISTGKLSNPYAIRALRSENHFERESGMAILKATGAVPTTGTDLIWFRLSELTVGEKPEVDPAQIDSLIKIENSTEGLIQVLSHKDEAIHEYAFQALERIGQPAAALAAEQADKQAAPDARVWFSERSKWSGAPNWRIDLWAAATALNPKFNLNKRFVTMLESGGTKSQEILKSKQFNPEREYIPLIINQFASITSTEKKDVEKASHNRNLAMVKLEKANDKALFPLLAALNDEDLSIAAWSAKTLLKIGDKSAHQAIIDAFSQRLNNSEELYNSPFQEAMQQLDLAEVEPLLLKVRPNATQAIKTFNMKYPGIHVTNVPMRYEIDPKLMAQPFRLKYILDGKAKELKVVFKPNDEGDWMPEPPLPDNLD